MTLDLICSYLFIAFVSATLLTTLVLGVRAVSRQLALVEHLKRRDRHVAALTARIREAAASQRAKSDPPQLGDRWRPSEQLEDHPERFPLLSTETTPTDRCPAPDDWSEGECSGVRLSTPLPESMAVGQDYATHPNCLRPARVPRFCDDQDGHEGIETDLSVFAGER